MSALGITALQHAQDEASASGRSRRKDATLYAGEAGLAMVQSNLLTNYNGATMPSFTIDEPALVNDGFGNPIAVRSGRPENAARRGDRRHRRPDVAEAPDGFLINLGNQSAQVVLGRARRHRRNRCRQRNGASAGSIQTS